jgi:hypothetical protein
MKRVRLAAALGLGLMALSCGGPTDPSKNTVETFSGSVQPLNFGPLHTFNVPNLGEITVTVTSITPGNTFLGVLYGQPTGNACGIIQNNIISSSNVGRTALSGSIIIKGQYCVQLFDPVNSVGAPLTVAQNYTVQVSHP